MDYNRCPFIAADAESQAYIKMGKVTCVTFSYTFYHALFFMLSKGWMTTNSVIDRDNASNLVLITGLIYLLYSGHFLSYDFTLMGQIVDSFLAIVYLVLGLVDISCLFTQIKIISVFRQNAFDLEIPGAF